MFCRFTLKTLTTALALLFLCLVASAGPCMPCQASNRRGTIWDQSLSTRGDYSPRITNPTNNTVWTPSSDVVVTWDARDMPENSELKGKILLGYLEAGNEDEHLDIQHPLASNFHLHDGFVTFKCPQVDPLKDYIVVLLGNSGNRSPTFTIRK